MTDTLTRARNVPEGPLPPQTLEAERSVLAAMLLDHESIGRALELLEGTSFYRAAHQKVFDAIVALYNRNERSDLVTVAEELRKRGELDAAGGPPGLSEVMEPGTTNEDLDRLTSGFQNGDLIIIAGRPSMGKSSLAVNIAENAAI